MRYVDQIGRELMVASRPLRIVSLVPSQTELLVDLGLKSSIVGVTKFCVHPSDLKNKKIVVGGTKDVHYDKIKELRPDIILCNKEENTQAMISQLEQVAPVHVSDIYTIDDSLELIKMYGELFNVIDNASKIVADIRSKFEEFRKWIINYPNLKAAYFIWKDPWMVVGRSTFIDELLRINNFENYFSNLSRYPEISLDDIDTSIDLIFFSSEPFPFKDKHFKEVYTKFPNSKIMIVNGEYFSWYGSRLILAVNYFKALREQLV